GLIILTERCMCLWCLCVCLFSAGWCLLTVKRFQVLREMCRKPTLSKMSSSTLVLFYVERQGTGTGVYFSPTSHPPTHSLTLSLTHSLSYSLTHSLTHSPTHSSVSQSVRS